MIYLKILKTPVQFYLAVITIAIISCGNPKEEKQTQSAAEKTEEHQHIEKSTLSLNNGDLWLANIETTQGVNQMASLMESFSDKESVEAYNELKTSLEKEFGTIIKECTMKGESHDQLHHFLLPMQGMFEGLGSSDLNTCKENYNILNDHLKKYPKYFN